MSDTKDLATGRPVALPSTELRQAIIDAWRAAFPKNGKVMLIGDLEGLRYAAQRGCGWRADCLGDLGGFSKNWNHMEHLYRQQLAQAGAQEAWRQGPVAFESCWDMRKWKQEGWDIRFIFDYALQLHASYMNNKSAPIPEGTRPEVERFLRRIGYRLVLREVEHPARAAPGEALPVRLAGENTGVAPPYRDDRLALRLTAAAGGEAKATRVSETSIRGWLPGPKTVRETLPLPRDLAPGRYQLAVAIVAPSTGEPALRLAIRGRSTDGWYRVSELQVR
jgi:hypothetical protein